MESKIEREALTYEEMFKKLKKDLASKAQIHFNIESSINQKEFTDPDSMEIYLRTLDEWQKASKSYAIFLSNIVDKDVNPNDRVLTGLE